MNKQVFRTHPILLIEGRLLGIILCCGLGAIIYGITIVSGWVRIVAVFLLCSLIGLGFFIRNILLDSCWAKLIVYDDKIVWRCLFRKHVTLNINSIRFAAIRVFDETEGNVVPDYYNVGRKYILLSYGQLPAADIQHIRSSDGIIKFPYSNGLAKALKARFPTPVKNVFQSGR